MNPLRKLDGEALEKVCPEIAELYEAAERVTAWAVLDARRPDTRPEFAALSHALAALKEKLR